MADLYYSLLLSLFLGLAIGIERDYQGRAAGSRTYMIICVTAAMLMVAVRQIYPLDSDTRVIQGILSGIGFLGAGVIVKDGLAVRGLTTAASIWMASAIGIVAGLGKYELATASTALALIVLVVFRNLSRFLPRREYSLLMIRFKQDGLLDEPALRALLKEHGYHIADLGYKQGKAGKYLEYKLMVFTSDVRNAPKLAESLYANPAVVEFGMSPTRDR